MFKEAVSRYVTCILFIMFVMNTRMNAQPAGQDDYMFSVSGEIYAPLRIATDCQGMVYVTDAFRKCIVKYDASGNYQQDIFTGGNPVVVAVSPSGQVIFSNNDEGSISKLVSNGSTVEIFNGLGYPSSATFDSENNLYVVDSRNRQVVVMDLSGHLLRTIGTDLLVFPTGIAFDCKNNRIVVSEHGGFQSETGPGLEAKILVFDLNGNLVSSFGEFGNLDGQFSRIQGVAVDKKGRIFGVDPYQASVSVFSESGEFITRLGEFGTGAGQLNMPMSIVLDSLDRAWVTSMNNRRLDVFGIGHIGESGISDITMESGQLLQNYPNPFSNGTWLPFILAEDEPVEMNIYNINGTLIRTYSKGHMDKGPYKAPGQAIYWDGNCENGQKAATGVYFYELKLSDTRMMRQMIFIEK